MYILVLWTFTVLVKILCFYKYLIRIHVVYLKYKLNPRLLPQYEIAFFAVLYLFKIVSGVRFT